MSSGRVEFLLVASWRPILKSNTQVKVKRKYNSIANFIKKSNVIDMISSELYEEHPLCKENYYSLAIPDSKLDLQVYMVVEKTLVTLDPKSMGYSDNCYTPDDNLQGIEYFKDMLILFYRNNGFEFRKAADFSLIGNIKSVLLLKKTHTNQWFTFSEMYRINSQGLLYIIDSNGRLRFVDLNNIEETLKRYCDPFMTMAENVISLELCSSQKRAVYQKSDKYVYIDMKKLFLPRVPKSDPTKRTKLAPVSLAAIRGFIVVSSSMPSTPHYHELVSYKGKHLSSLVVDLQEDSKGTDIKTTKAFFHQGVCFVVVGSYWSFAYIVGIFKKKLLMVKPKFNTRGEDSTSSSSTLNCLRIVQSKRSSTLFFCGYSKMLTCLLL